MEDFADFLSEFWWILLLIASGIFAIWYFFARKESKDPNAPIKIGGVTLPSRWNHQYSRPDGGYVVSMYPIPADKQQEVLQRIVTGLQRTIDAATAANPTWTRFTNTRDYDIIHLIEPQATNMDGSPALLVYDMYQSAGTVINVGLPAGSPQSTPYLVLPDQGHPDYNWEYLDYFEASIRHESEHAIEWMNNHQVFWYYVGPNDVHPHWPDVTDYKVSTAVEVPCWGYK